MIVVNCIGHSGFTVESESHMLIFDYSEGVISRIPKNKKLYVFVSHVHEDHFNPEIFNLCKEHPNVRYILSYDIPKSIIRDYGITEYITAEPGMDIKPESRFRIKALPSTDCGVAYLAGCMGRNIFHAGDLNLWLWEGMSEAEIYAMTMRFKQYTAPLRAFWIDTAFIPLDTRQGIYSFLGFDYYMKHFRIKNVVPMHFFGSHKIVEDIMADPISLEYRKKIITMTRGEKKPIV